MSLFSAVEMAPRDPILGLNEQFNADTNPHKVNLGVGVYFDDNGKLPLLQVRGRPPRRRWWKRRRPRGYLPIDGIAAYDKAVQGLVFGADSEAVHERPRRHRAGPGRHRRPEDRRRLPEAAAARSATVLISDPSWENHRALFTQRRLRGRHLPLLRRRPRAACASTPCWPR